jgi:hypothetical protein
VDSRNFFIISSSKNWAESVKRYVENIYNAYACIIETPQLVRKESSSSDKIKIELLDAFNFIYSQIEKHANSVLRNSIAILDICLYGWNLDPLYMGSEPKNSLASMLALAFSEIHWLFPMMMKKRENDINDTHTFYWIEGLKGIFKKIQLLSSPMFDPYNLRNSIRKNMKDSDKTVKKYLQLHNEGDSASIDEEEPYAHLHGYLAYKLGHKCFLVTTRKMMEQVLIQNNAEDTESKPNIDLVFEDIFLNFPDRGKETHLSNLRERDKTFKSLKDVKDRIFVTVGHRHISWHESNKIYIEELRAQGKTIKKVYKPSGGMYNILEQAGLLEKYWKRKKEEWKEAKPDYEPEPTGHSAPGRLLVIAEKLIDRAEKIFHEAMTVQDCIHGALLALEAQELLGYRTPTTSLEAIALRHQLEVKAECMFYGVEYNIDVKNRMMEIEAEVKAVSRWFHPSVKKKSALNAQMEIITEINKILRDSGQFDEEQECLKCLRKLNRRWYFLNHPWLSFLWPFRWYIESLVGSFPLFVAAILGWPFLFGIISSALNIDFGLKSDDLLTYLTNSFSTFFGLQPTALPSNPFAQLLTIFMISIGFLHLGIFISYLYTLITRR